MWLDKFNDVKMMPAVKIMVMEGGSWNLRFSGKFESNKCDAILATVVQGKKQKYPIDCKMDM